MGSASFMSASAFMEQPAPVSCSAMIPLARPWLAAEELEAIERVLRSGQLVQGQEVARFEAMLAERCARRFAIAVSSGTAALDLALQAVVSEHDPRERGEVLCPALTWPSPAHAVQARGLETVLVDVDPEQWNVRGTALAAARTERCKAAIVIDQLGNPAPWGEIGEALGGLPLIEDAACALGSELGGAPCGSFGLVSCLSFHPRKVITTGEGGACLTDDEGIAQELRELRNHGQKEGGGFARAALNYRLSEMQAAMGSVQMSRLDALIEERRRLAGRYAEALPELRFQRAPEGGRSNAQTIAAVLPEGADAAARDRLRARLRESGIELGLLSIAVHRIGSVPHEGPLTTTETLADRGISLPAYHGMSDEELTRVVRRLRVALAQEQLV